MLNESTMVPWHGACCPRALKITMNLLLEECERQLVVLACKMRCMR